MLRLCFYRWHSHGKQMFHCMRIHWYLIVGDRIRRERITHKASLIEVGPPLIGPPFLPTNFYNSPSPDVVQTGPEAHFANLVCDQERVPLNPKYQARCLLIVGCMWPQSTDLVQKSHEVSILNSHGYITKTHDIELLRSVWENSWDWILITLGKTHENSSLWELNPLLMKKIPHKSSSWECLSLSWELRFSWESHENLRRISREKFLTREFL